MLYPLRHILSLPQKLLITVSRLITIWLCWHRLCSLPQSGNSLLHRVQRVQNLCLRFCYGARKFDHVSPLFRRSRWLTIRQRFILHLCCLSYNVIQSGTILSAQPTSLQHWFPQFWPNHPRTILTRFSISSHIKIPKLFLLCCCKIFWLSSLFYSLLSYPLFL